MVEPVTYVLVSDIVFPGHPTNPSQHPHFIYILSLHGCSRSLSPKTVLFRAWLLILFNFLSSKWCCLPSRHYTVWDRTTWKLCCKVTCLLAHWDPRLEIYSAFRKLGCHSFAHAVPQVVERTPVSIRMTTSLAPFSSSKKTFLTCIYMRD